MSELIDKQAALDALRSRQTYLFDSKDPDKKIELRSAEMAIEEQPTIQPERKQGEWINEGRIIRCSKCKIGYAVVKGMKSAITYNFCPSCGADMRGEQDERDD